MGVCIDVYICIYIHIYIYIYTLDILCYLNYVLYVHVDFYSYSYVYVYVTVITLHLLAILTIQTCSPANALPNPNHLRRLLPLARLKEPDCEAKNDWDHSQCT